MNIRPANTEYSPYHEQYISEVPEGDIIGILTQSLEATVQLLSNLSEDKGNARYAPGKWSLKEVLGHINDNERIMSYRLLRIARGDATPLAGYDQDELMKGVSFDSCTLASLVEEYTYLRRSTLSLLHGLSEEAWARRGIVGGGEISAKAWAYIIAGHELHHLKVIKERYLAQ
ncbi:MAG: DinB family protein [Gorillibacterium sp.]|nr:DinB family protein [Gorillibacterium sp.]